MRIVLLMLALCGVLPMCADESPMQKTAWLVGTWEGSGWIDMRGEKSTFTQREVVKMQAGGLVLAIEGTGRNAEGKVTHFIGYHREGGTRPRASGESGIRGLPTWVREDRLTGLASRYYFEDVLKRDFALAQRDKTEIALLLFDIDQLGPYNEIFDRTGGDAVVKRVARAIAGSFRRGTDIVGRWDGASVIVLMHGTQADHVIQHATTVAHRVREQQIHHPRSTQKYVTVSGGVAVHTARPEDSAEKFLQAVENAVSRAKEQGRNRIIVAEESDFR